MISYIQINYFLFTYFAHMCSYMYIYECACACSWVPVNLHTCFCISQKMILKSLLLWSYPSYYIIKVFCWSQSLYIIIRWLVTVFQRSVCLHFPTLVLQMHTPSVSVKKMEITTHAFVTSTKLCPQLCQLISYM